MNILILKILTRFKIKHYKLRTAYYVFCYAILFLYTTHAQQNPQFSQYLQNPFVINPAMTGVENYIDLNAAYRNQWTGIEGAPKTTTFGINSSLYPTKASYLSNEGLSHQGLGAFVYTDDFGPIEQNGFHISYAYHLKVSDNWFLSLGTFIGATQFKFDNSDVVLINDPNDIIIQNNSNLNFDMSLGIYAYSKHLFLGIAANQILNNQIGFSNTSTVNTILPNYNMLVGSRITVSKTTELVPYALIKTVKNAPLRWDTGFKLIYNNKFWGGLSYRDEEAIVGFIGLSLTKNLLLSYSYDWITSKFSGQQSGSHEIIIGYRFNLAKLHCACPKYSL